MSDGKKLHICLIAGEPSGDVLGGRLIKALKDQAGSAVSFSGVGCAHMNAEEGFTSLFPMEDLSVMGLAEVLPRLPKLFRRRDQVVAHIEMTKPDIVVTIDSPDFCFRVVQKLRKRGLHLPRLAHYVAPTVWAWRPERAAKLASLYNGVLCLFPFEPPYFEREGMKAVCVGHPMIESTAPLVLPVSLKEQLRIPEDKESLGIFFGSRWGEINRMGPILREAAFAYVTRHPATVIIAPTLPHLEREVRALLQKMPCKVRIVSDRALKPSVFNMLDKALATSGTVGLELGVAGVPHIIGYKVNGLTWNMVKHKLTTRYAHLINILLDRPVVPEFIQENCTSSSIVAALESLDMSAQRAAFIEARQLLSGAKENSLPSQQAASFILDL